MRIELSQRIFGPQRVARIVNSARYLRRTSVRRLNLYRCGVELDLRLIQTQTDADIWPPRPEVDFTAEGRQTVVPPFQNPNPKETVV
jgi:hypothetical protein